MRESFPEYKKGQALSASILNEQNKLLEKFAKPGTQPAAAYPLRVVIITAVNLEPSDVDDESDESSHSSSSGSMSNSSSISSSGATRLYYECRHQWYYHQAESWQTDNDEGPFDLDASAFDGEFEVGDRTIAYWDQQRDMYVANPSAASGSGGCESQNAIIDITIFGSPTGGTFTSDWTINGVITTGMGFAFDCSAATFQSTLEALVPIPSGSVLVTGGPFPNATMRIEFKGTLANLNVALPTANWGSLTGGTGVGVICSLAQLGHSA